MSTRKLLLLCCALGFATHLFANSELTSEESARFQAKVKEILQRASRYYEEFSVSFSADPPKEFTLTQDIHSVFREEKYIEWRSEIAKIELKKSTGELHTFVNYELVDKKRSLDPERKKWTEEEAEKVAREFVIALVGSMPENLEAKPRIHYKPRRMFVNQVIGGEWEVVWGRVDKRGHVFWQDCVRVRMRDDDPPRTLTLSLWSKYDDKDFEPIPKEKAQKLAKKGSGKILAWDPAKEWFHNFSLEMEDPAAELIIVNPNTAAHKTSDIAAPARFPTKARLAWVIKYPIRYTGPKCEDSGTPMVGTGILEVWIDAENGKFLGGMF